MTDKLTKSYIASDYAGLVAGDLDFYYGYEFGRTEDGDEIWGFCVNRGDERIFEIPCEDESKRFNVAEMLLEGIAEYLIKGE